MLRKLLPIATLLLLAATVFVMTQAPAHADPCKDEARQFERYAPRGHTGPPQWVPPGHRRGHHKWVPPGHRKHGDVHPYRYDDDWRYRRDRERYDDCDRWDDDRYRHRDRRDWRYEPRKHRRYDRDNEDYGLIIRKGPHGTTVEVEYHKRDR